MSFENYSDQLFVKGLLIQIPPGQDSGYSEISFPFDSKLKGALIITSDCKYGDYGDLTVHHPSTGDELARFAETVYLPEGNRQLQIEVDNGSAVVTGLMIRVSLQAIDTLGRNAIIWLLVKK